MKAGWIALALVALVGRGHAQAAKPVGTVAPADATVTSPGAAATLQMTAGKTQVSGGATVTARPGRNAEVALTRGGSVLVCQSTAVHMTPSADNSLLLALDRGALEIRMKAGAGDVIMTPDMRFTPAAAGPLDLRMRVTFNGDTCVENRGHKAPALNISDAFGEVNYLLKPGQHVLFENGSLRTVEDHETTPCGCPPDAKQPADLTLADAILSGKPLTPAQTAAAHPFPEAQSEGLADPAPGVPETPGIRHVQVASTLRFDPSSPEATPAAATIAPQAAAAPPTPAAPAPPPQKPGAFAAIGQFFKRIFVR